MDRCHRITCMHLYFFMLNFLQTFIENGLPGAILKKLSVYIFNLHWYAASRKLMMTWSFLSKFVFFYQTSVKKCLTNFLQCIARRLIFSNSSSVQLGGKSHSPITNDNFCLHNGRERKWLLSPDQCSSKHYKNTIQVGSKHQTIKTGDCSILH